MREGGACKDWQEDASPSFRCSGCSKPEQGLGGDQCGDTGSGTNIISRALAGRGLRSLAGSRGYEILLLLQYPATTSAFDEIASRAALHLGDEIMGLESALDNAEYSRIVYRGDDFLRNTLVAAGNAHFNSTNIDFCPYFFCA